MNPKFVKVDTLAKCTSEHVNRIYSSIKDDTTQNTQLEKFNAIITRLHKTIEENTATEDVNAYRMKLFDVFVDIEAFAESKTIYQLIKKHCPVCWAQCQAFMQEIIYFNNWHPV